MPQGIRKNEASADPGLVASKGSGRRVAGGGEACGYSQPRGSDDEDFEFGGYQGKTRGYEHEIGGGLSGYLSGIVGGCS